MFSFGIIVFREVLEIALVLSILLAGTRGVAGRTRWIGFGILLGILGSGLVALCTEKISAAMEGFGQEVFYATVLLLAALLIGWTVIWMKRHAREITQNLKRIGHEVSSGSRPLYILAVVIALTILRDGSEIILLGHGVLASSTHMTSIIIGGAVGLAAGIVIGLGIYFGIIRAATRHIFEVTSWLLIILCAGMVSQAVGLLASADLLPQLVYPLWDTSHLLPEHTFLGETLHVMFGYSARPSGMQLLSYVLTIGLVVFALRRVSARLQTPAVAA